MAEICDVKRSYGPDGEQLYPQPSYTVEEVEEEDGSTPDQSNEIVPLASNDARSWEVINETITFTSSTQGDVGPYKPLKEVSYLMMLAAGEQTNFLLFAISCFFGKASRHIGEGSGVP